MIDKEQFNKFLDQGHDYIPLQKKLDLKKEHPLSLFKKVSHLKNNFLLESVEGGNKLVTIFNNRIRLPRLY